MDAWRPAIETRLTEALGVPVRLGELQAAAHGLSLTLRVKDLQLLDPAGMPALTLPQVEARLSPRSWVGRGLVLDDLRFDGADLEIRRDALGRLHVAGLPVAPQAASDRDGSPAADWVLRQRQIVVQGAAVRWIDDTRVGAGPLALSDVSIVLRNGLRQHDVRLDATPPAGWGRRFTAQGRFTQDLLARPSDLSRWDGSLHVDLPEADLGALREHAHLPFDLREGHGALRAWMDIRDGLPVGITTDVALQAVALRLSPRVEPLEFSEVRGRLAARRSADAVTLQATALGFTTGDGVVWPPGDVRLSWRQAQAGPLGGPGQPVTGGEFSADRLDLAVISQVAERLPLGDAVHRLIDTLQPAGVVQRLSGRWEGPPDAPWRYQVQGEARDLALAPGRLAPDAVAGTLARPGGSGAKVAFKATERGGDATVALERGVLDFPGLFDDPRVPLRELKARLAWTVVPVEMADAPPRVEVKVTGARFANADARGSLDLHWRTGAGAGHGSGGRWPGLIDLNARLDGGRADQVARYLPRGLPVDVRDYLGRALRGGEITGATVTVRGDLWDFPYAAAPGAAPHGDFKVVATVRDAELAYVPDEPARGTAPAWRSPWPALRELSAEVAIDRTSLSIRQGRARLGRVELADVQGRIPDLVQDVTLQIGGVARGAAQDMLAFVSATPVKAWTHESLEGLRASGPLEVQLALQLPLQDLERTSVQGTVRLQGNDLRWGPGVPTLAGARGRVEFTERGLSVNGASARVAGGDATVDGGLLPDGRLRFTASGVATAEGLRQTPELGLPPALLSALSGQAAYRLQMSFRGDRADWLLTSPLSGLGVALPAPLGKAAEATVPLRVEVAGSPADGPSRTVPADRTVRDQLRIDLGEAIQARYWRETQGDEPRVTRGAIAVNDRLAEPGDGVVARVRLPALDLDAWRSSGFGAPPGTGSGTDTARAAQTYLPTDITLRTNELRGFERRLTRVDLRAVQRAGAWRAEVSADQMAGSIEWSPEGAGDRLRARLARLSLPPSDAAAVERLLDAPPANLPALDVVVDDFTLRDRQLGRLEIEAVNRPTAAGLRDWQLSRLALSNPDARLTAHGHWNAVDADSPGVGPPGPRPRVTSLDFKLDVNDSGSLLERLGQGRTLRGGQGVMSGRVQWVGSPLDPAFASMSGTVALDLDRGQFLRAEPGAARLLGVLNLQALPRRLALDFRDVFQEGFSFDEITGNVRIDEGVARTNNLRMRGVQAAVLMDGSADLRTETQQLRVVVVPEINAGTASLAYATINPAIGLGTFLAQAFLRRPLAEAGTREFRVSGSWADPKVERVERGAPQGAAPLDDPPGSTTAAGAPSPRQPP